MREGGVSPADWVAVSVLALAALRGLFIGLAREVSSLAALGGACVAVRLGLAPASERLEAWTGLGGTPARLVAAAALIVLTLVVVVSLGRLARRGIRAAGLGLWDRLAGGVLGAAEGAVLAALLLLLAVATLGRDHPALARTRALAAFERVERLAGRAPSPLADVAAPPRR